MSLSVSTTISPPVSPLVTLNETTVRYPENPDQTEKDISEVMEKLNENLQLPPDYFVRTPFFWRWLVPYGLFLTMMSWLAPDLIPTYSPLGALASYLGTAANRLMGIIFTVAVLLHVTESGMALHLALYTYNLNREVVFQWWLQTLHYGIFSLWYLLKPRVQDIKKAS